MSDSPAPPSSPAPAEPAAATPFTVRNPRGEALSCVLDPGLPSQPVAVFVHGFRDSKNGRCVRSVAEELAARGLWRTLRFDCSGNGQSEGAFQFANYEQEMHDLRAVVLHARQQLALDVACIVGHSKGAGVVLLYAQNFHDVRLVVSLAARFHMACGVKERFGESLVAECMEKGKVEVTLRDGFTFFLTKDSLHERLRLDMGDVASAIPSSIAVLTIHGEQDTTIPVGDAFEFDARIANHTLRVLPAACHKFIGFQVDVVDALSAAWELRTR